jgi:hypothetical protein
MTRFRLGASPSSHSSVGTKKRAENRGRDGDGQKLVSKNPAQSPLMTVLSDQT